MRIGILTSGGDCPGLNAVLRGFCKCAFNIFDDVEILGFTDGYAGLMNKNYRTLTPADVENILDMGGTILGTSRQPYKMMTVKEGDAPTKLQTMVENYKKLKLDCLVTLGGAGTHKTASLLSVEGCNVIGLPKTIDNDIYGTDVTFGFRTAVEVVTDSLDRIKTTVASHRRTMLVEIMGNKAGWLTLDSGIAAGVDMILIPEMPIDVDAVCEYVAEGRSGKPYNIIAVAEGALLASEAPYKKSERVFARSYMGETTITRHLAETIGERTGTETRYTVLGYLQRGGTPCAYDRLLCTRLGGFAGKLAKDGRFGVTAAVVGGRITFNALGEIAGKYKLVDPEGPEVRCARDLGIGFGVARRK